MFSRGTSVCLNSFEARVLTSQTAPPGFEGEVSISTRVSSKSLAGIYWVEPVIAVLLLIATAPVLLILGTFILLLSGRSPFVRHVRVGWRGRPLRLLKFRTMWDSARSPNRFSWIEDVSGFVPAEKSCPDLRVKSRFAALCRRHSLDELPQLVHIARGEMSFVGPRPITQEEHSTHYGEDSEEVLSARPGLTGLWQVTGRNALSYMERRRLDLLFVRQSSPRLYFDILRRTIPKVIRGDGAY